MNLGEEDEQKEFKQSLAQLKEGTKSLTAMLNRNGHGIVYYGVNDDGSIRGLTITKNTLVDLRTRIKDLIEPQIIPVIEDLCDEEKRHFIKLEAHGYNKPYSNDGRYYIRTAASDEKVSTELLRRMLVSGTTDLISEMKSEEQHLTFDELVEYLNNEGVHTRKDKAYYKSAGLMTPAGQFNFMAFMLSDQNKVTLKVVRFAGNDKSVMSERTEYNGHCLLNLINQVFNYVTSFISTKVSLKDGNRREFSLFDKEAFREAWVNACVHNTWSEKISPSVYMFDDRIEIVSYGSIPYDLTLDGFYSGTSMPVNNGLFTIFINAGLTEQSGHGIPKIVSVYGKDAFSFKDNMIKVTLKYSFEPEFVLLRKIKEKQSNELTKKQKVVYQYLSEHSDTTLKDVAEETGISLGGVKKIVSRLKDLGLLERIGSKKDGKWITQ